MTPLVRLEGDGIADLNTLANAHMAHLHPLFVGSGTDPQKGDTVTVSLIHIGLDLEDKTGKLLFFVRY